MLRNGGIWAYCQDDTEGMNAFLKRLFAEFTNRGATENVHFIEQIWHRHFMQLHACIYEEGLGRIPQINYELRKINKMMDLL